MEVSLAEVLDHGDRVEAGFGAVDRQVAVAAVHRPHHSRFRHAVIDADRRLLLLLLRQQALARHPSAGRLFVAVRV